MALITITLSEITSPPIKGDTRTIMDEIIGRLLDLSYKELDSHYGTQDWCLHPKIYAFPGPYPKVTINVEVSDNYSYDDLSYHVSSTFNKHWAEVIKETYERMG